MRLNLKALIGLSILILLAGSATLAQTNYRISAPYTFKNLTIFLIHGKDSTNKKNIITLQEALEMMLCLAGS